MTDKFHFTFKNLEMQYQAALDEGYTFCTCEEYMELKISGLPEKLIVNRIDIDFSAKKAGRLLDIFNKLNIKGSFFIRLHAPEYNPFSFENYRIIKAMINSGHEIGYHSEIVDQSIIWEESAEACLLKDIDIINRMFDINIVGVASHGGNTGLNNLDFWKSKTANNYGLSYEAYDKEEGFNLFDTSFYISDSEWTQWKCYNRGIAMPGDQRTFQEHLTSNHELIYLLIHSDTYFDHHFYE